MSTTRVDVENLFSLLGRIFFELLPSALAIDLTKIKLRCLGSGLCRTSRERANLSMKVQPLDLARYPQASLLSWGQGPVARGVFWVRATRGNTHASMTVGRGEEFQERMVQHEARPHWS